MFITFLPSLSVIHKIILELFWRDEHRSNMVSVITSQNKNSPWKPQEYWEYKLPDLPKKYWLYDETLNAIDNNSNISAPTVSLTRNCRYNVSIDSLSLAPHPGLCQPRIENGKIDLNFLKKKTNSWKSNSFKYFDNNVDTKLLVSGNDNTIFHKVGENKNNSGSGSVSGSQWCLTSFNRDRGRGQQLAGVPGVTLVQHPWRIINNCAGLGGLEPCTAGDYVVWCWNEESN